MATVVIRYWAAAKDAAGIPEENLEAETLGEALAIVTAKHVSDGRRLAAVLARSSFLVDGKQAGHVVADEMILRPGAVIEVLPPFAGG